MVPKIVFVIGEPDSGKVIQCKRISQRNGYKYLSVDELLNAQIMNKNSKYGTLIKNTIMRGEIVPSKVICGLLEEAIGTVPNDKFLIDGFPRNKENVECYEKYSSSKIKLMFVLYLHCPEKNCVQGCLNRCITEYTQFGNKKNVSKNRYKTHCKLSQEVIDYYDQKNMLRRVDANRNENEVFKDIKFIFDNIQFIDDYLLFSVL